MNQTLAETKLRFCQKCGYEAETAELKCPNCGRPLFTAANIRTRGTVLIVCGTFLTVLMGIVLSNISPKLAALYADSESHGTAANATQIIAILVLTMAAGVSFLIDGIWQVFQGRRTRILTWLSISIVVALAAVSVIFLVGVKLGHSIE